MLHDYINKPFILPFNDAGSYSLKAISFCELKLKFLHLFTWFALLYCACAWWEFPQVSLLCLCLKWDGGQWFAGKIMSLRARKNQITAWSRSFGHIGWIYCFPNKYRITIGLRFITWTQLVSLKIVRMLTWVGTILASDLEQRGKIKMLILFCFKWILCVVFCILFIDIWEFILLDHFRLH